MTKVAVLGAGVVGLSTALNIKESIPNCDVTVIADKFNQDTTSDGAAGIFTPPRVPGIPSEISRKWVSDSWDHYRKLVESEVAPLAGVSRISGYYVFKDVPEQLPLFRDFCYDFRLMTPRELSSVAGGNYKYGWKVTSVLVEGRWYLPWLINRLENAGGKLRKGTIQSIDELIGEFDVIVNCTGLGSRTLCNDQEVFPVRGQVMRVKAPWIKHFYREPEIASYVIPGQENVVIGGTLQDGNDNPEVSSIDRKEILDKCLKLVPSLKHAEMDREWVGLRPWRNPVRLETECVVTLRGNITVIHNYGHRDIGISLSWGTAKAATLKLKEVLSSHKAKL